LFQQRLLSFFPDIGRVTTILVLSSELPFVASCVTAKQNLCPQYFCSGSHFGVYNNTTLPSNLFQQRLCPCDNYFGAFFRAAFCSFLCDGQTNLYPQYFCSGSHFGVYNATLPSNKLQQVLQ